MTQASEDARQVRQRERRPAQSWKRAKGAVKRMIQRSGYRVERIAEAPGEAELLVPLDDLVRLDPAAFYDILCANKAVLYGEDWAAQAAHLDSGLFRWGIPVPVDITRREPNVTYSEVIAYLARWLPAPPRYMEVGVSIGMNFLPLCRQFSAGTLLALDVEAPFPTLRAALHPRGQIAAWPGTVIDRHGHEQAADFAVDRFTLSEAFRQRYPLPAEAGPDIYYARADLFESQSWSRLRPATGGRPFNVIFSDAWHRPYALRHEYARLIETDLIDPEAFLLVWDDLGGAMTTAFLEIFRDLKGRYGPGVHGGLLEVYGTYHVTGRPHRLGYVAKLPEAAPPLPATL